MVSSLGKLHIFFKISLYSWCASTHRSGTASPTTTHVSAAAHRSRKGAFESFFLNMKLLKYKCKNAILGKRPLRFRAHRLTQLDKLSTFFGMKTPLINPEAGAELSRESTLLHVSSALGRFVGMVCFQCPLFSY